MEIKEKLIQEAKNRGFVKGAVFKDLHIGYERTIDKVMYHHDSKDIRNTDGGCIYSCGKWAEIISYKEEMETPKHYDNSKGSIYQFCENQNLNSYEFEVVKRITRCRKKGEFLSDIKKTIQVLEIYLQEQGEKFKGENEILNK